MEMITRRRDPQTGQPSTHAIQVDPARTVIAVIDAWAYHWCITWCGLAGGRIPRLDRALGAARRLGFTIVHCPTDFAYAYVGWPQRQRMAALPREAMPGAPLKLPPFPDGDAGPHSRGCLCAPQPRMCVPNYGGAGLDPRLHIDERDLICGDGVELFTWCRAHDITRIIYAGFATNMCLTGKPEGLAALAGAGLDCVFAGDQTEAHGTNTGAASADRYTAACVAHVEKFAAPSIDLVAELRRAGAWDDEAIVDPVRVVPWGFADRSCHFDGTVTVTMTFPSEPGAQLHYTLDGIEPTPRSPRYDEAIHVDRSCVLKVAAFVSGRQRSVPTECHYTLRPPAPPRPDVPLSDMQPVRAIMTDWVAWWSKPSIGSEPPPQKDHAYGGGEMTLRGVRYERGMGVRSPAELIYEVPARATRFVAMAGLDEGLLRRDLARGVAAYMAARFAVWVDGREMASSPVMHLGTPPWPFDVALPTGSRVVSLIVTPANASQVRVEANWADAGFA